jgi:hypothetical protein
LAGLLKEAGTHEFLPSVAVDAAVLESYAGTYRSDQIPVEVKVFTREGRLYLQAAGQQELATKAVSTMQFAYVPAQIEVEFDGPDSFTLKQGGGSFKFRWKNFTPSLAEPDAIAAACARQSPGAWRRCLRVHDS